MKPSTTLAIGTLMFIYSCKQDYEQSPHSSLPEVVAAHGYVVPKDSIAEPKVIPAGKPKVVRIGKPKVVPTNTNVHPAGNPRVVMAGAPKVCTPGEDSFSLPEKIPAIDNPFIAGIPEIVMASKEQNQQNFSSFGETQGLKDFAVRCMMEDKSGNLWIGTRGGVSKYDGKNFTNFTSKEGLSGNDVRSIFQDKRGNLWFGTLISGVSKYDGKRFTNFTVKEGLSHDGVTSILEDKSGNLWFGTAAGVSKYDGKNFTRFTAKEGLSHDWVSSIVEDKNGDLWFGTNAGVSKYDGRRFTNFTEKEGLSSNDIMCILRDKSGNLWFGTGGGGVCKYDYRSFTHFTVEEGLSSNRIFSMAEDKRGNLWFATGGSGVSKYDPHEGGTPGRSFTHFTEKEGLSNNNVRSVLVDKRGNLWFGTNGGGVNKYGDKGFSHFTVKEGLSDNIVRCILEDKRADLWFGTDRGVSRYDGQSFSNITGKEGLRFVWNLLRSKSGHLWVGSFWGIGEYDGKNFTHIAGEEIDGNDIDVKCMMEDKSGNLWLGTYNGGVVKYDGKRFTHFTEKQGLSNNAVRGGIEQDRNGNLWFATGRGLSKYHPTEKSFTHFTEKGGLRDNKISAILVNKTGDLWIGTANGVSKYDGNNFTHFTEREGLSANDVRSIMEDRSGNLWFATARGLSKLEKDKLASLQPSDSAPLFKNYPYEGGFSGFSDSYGKKLCEAKDGAIWIAAYDRLTAFHPDEDIDTIPPDIQLTGLLLFNENISWQNLEKKIDTSIMLGNGVSVHDFHFDSVSKWYGIPEDLSLPYNDNSLTFQFVGITTQSPKKVRYKYKLEALDKNWSTLTNRAEATFGNLPHGKYIFKVKAMNGDGYWSNEYHYSFAIRPPWWHTWWAYSLFTLMFLSFTYALYRYRVNKIHTKHEIVLQKHRAAELEMQALRSQMNPHFIFNSLNSINLFILENNKLQASEYLAKFSRLVRLILHNSEESFIPLERELEALGLYLELESLRFEDKFTYNITVEGSIDTTVVKVPPLIIQPYAENAIWHGLIHKKEEGHLEIKLYQDDKLLYCKIADDGIGRTKAAQLKSKSASGRKSVGMRITANRLAILESDNMKTNVIVKDVVLPDGEIGGTEVLLSIPVVI